MAIVLYPQSLTDKPHLLAPSESSFNEDPAFFLLFAFSVAQELFIGYLIGFVASFIFEAISLAGELIDTMVGFSAAQFFDPFSLSFHTLTNRLLLLCGALIMMVLDFHLLFIHLLADTFSLIPLGSFLIPTQFLENLTAASGQIFSGALRIALIPLAIITAGLVGIALSVRVIPEMNLLLIGLPLRVIIGLFSLIAGIGPIIHLYRHLFNQSIHWIRLLLKMF